MEHDFLDGIDEAFQRLSKLNGNGKRNGHSMGRSSEDRVIIEIVSHLDNLSSAQKKEVLDFVLSLERK
jgi:hypothetical protein